MAISRDIYKKAYGRNIEALLSNLSNMYELYWVGLDATKSSLFGKKIASKGETIVFLKMLKLC